MAETNTQSGIVLHGLWTRYSSWTARVVLLLEYFNVPYTAKYYSIYGAGGRPAFLQGRLVPLLQPDPQDSDFIIDESLAICEYLAESFPERGLWPKDTKLRALARAAAAQMHAGFSELRDTYHTNFIAKYTGNIPVSDAAKAEIRKMTRIWNTARAQTKQRLQELGEKDEGFLFGTFSIADAFFWPVLWRFRSYQLPLEGINSDGLEWMSTMWNDPVTKAQGRDYFQQANDPQTTTERYDDIFKGNPEIQYGRFDEDWEFAG